MPVCAVSTWHRANGPGRQQRVRVRFVGGSNPLSSQRPARTSHEGTLRTRWSPCRSQQADATAIVSQPPVQGIVVEGPLGVAGVPGVYGNGNGAGVTSAAREVPAVEGIQMQPQKDPKGLYVRVRSMVKHFDTPNGVFRAVDNVDVDIAPSSITALLGPSGSGKTTLLRLIAGLERPTSGQIFFDNLDATDLSVQDRGIGFVFQSYALFNHKTVAENIKFGLQVRRLQVNHDRRVADLLELVQLSGLGDRYPKQLSGGQRQRVALARALASNPRLLLLDEPFGALDAVVRKQLRSGLKEIVRTVGVTTIIVTHDQEEAFDLADHVVVFNRGVVEQEGQPTALITQPHTPFIMKFVGDTNTLPANSLLVRRSRLFTSKSGVLVRPTALRLYRSPDASGGATVTPALVAECQNLGWLFKYTLRFDDDVEVEWPVTRQQYELGAELEVGERVYVHAPAHSMMPFDEDEIDSAPRL